MKENILFLGDINLDYLQNFLWENYNFLSDYNTDDENIKIIVVRWANFSLDKDYLAKHKNLKAIFVLGIGTDNIDLNYCKEKNILVSNEPTISTYSVAELTVSMLIGGLRQVYATWLNLKNGVYSRNPMWNNLTWKRIWVLWYGNIWKLTVKLLNCFRQIRDFDLFVYDINEKQYDDFLNENNIQKAKDFNNFLENIDYLIIHIYGWEQNMNLINKKVLENTSIKWIVNTARKWIVNEEDILSLLDGKKMEFYVTDVVMWEPKAENINSKLLAHNRVFITPHIWANTYQIQKDLLDSLVNKIKKLDE